MTVRFDETVLRVWVLQCSQTTLGNFQRCGGRISPTSTVPNVVDPSQIFVVRFENGEYQRWCAHCLHNSAYECCHRCFE